ncbi:anthranilate O-methyltransferase 3-like [Musa acuminata AAA Group]|uniref:anthranilate O-methyltransferase 3-like n=1 Tax=Musa acuminata AAA Group TaxID=214697 RepID=UPI0031DCEDC5
MAIKVEQALHMVGGAGETSYATNSRLQEKALYRTKPILETAIAELYQTLLPERMVVVDLGCSSGPNTFLVVYEVLGIVGDLCRRLEQKPPEIQFFLNDLPGNDFNNVFRSLERYEKKMEEEKGDLLVPHYVVGMPGSFYGRLFPRNTVHIFHSNYCLMWLSQVPQGLESEQGVPLNKGNIYIAENSPPQVVNAYQEQHRRDFSTFLKSRYMELSIGGGMVLTFLGRRNKEPANGGLSYMWGLLAEALNAMVSQGIVSEDKLDAFNLPIYTPSMQEVKAVIHDEGLFDLEQAQIFECNWDPFDDTDDDDIVFDNVLNGKNVAKCVRAVSESLIAHHFGDAILDELFSRYADKVARHLLKEKTKHTVMVIALKKKA